MMLEARDWIVVGFLTVLDAWTTLLMPKFWRGDLVIPGVPRRADERHLYGIPVVSVFLGRILLVAVVACSSALGFVYAEAIPHVLGPSHSRTFDGALAVAATIFLRSMQTSVVVMFVVAFTGWPEFLVPPPYRRPK